MSTNNCGCTTTTTNICSEPVKCSCPTLLSSSCVNNVDLECSNILKGQTLSEVLVLLDEFICTKFDSVTNFFQLINVGTGSEVYKGVSMLGKKEMRTLLDSGLINLVQGTNDITISVDEVALNTFIEANQKTYSVANIGTGANVYKDSTISGDNTQFNVRKINTSNSGAGAIVLKPQVENTNDISIVAKSLKSSNSSVTITEGTNDIDLTVLVEDAVTNGSLIPVTSNAVFDALATASVEVKKEYIVIPLGDLITNLTIGTTKAYFRMPFSATVNSVSASVLEAQASGSILTFDINENGASILSTKITIDNTEKTSITAVTQPVISDTTLAFDAEITFDIDQIGTAGAKGAVITLNLTRV